MNTKMNLYNTALLAQLQGVSKNMGIQWRIRYRLALL